MNELVPLYTVTDQYQLFNISPTYHFFVFFILIYKKKPKTKPDMLYVVHRPNALTLGHSNESFFILPLQYLFFHRCCSLSPGGQASQLIFYIKSILCIFIWTTIYLQVKKQTIPRGTWHGVWLLKLHWQWSRDDLQFFLNAYLLWHNWISELNCNAINWKTHSVSKSIKK